MDAAVVGRAAVPEEGDALRSGLGGRGFAAAAGALRVQDAAHAT